MFVTVVRCIRLFDCLFAKKRGKTGSPRSNPGLDELRYLILLLITDNDFFESKMLPFSVLQSHRTLRGCISKTKTPTMSLLMPCI